jgi:spoIIIJ-associated protein
MKKNDIKTIEGSIKKLIDHLGVNSDFELIPDEKYLKLHFLTKEGSAGLLIGNKGKNLLSIQYVLNLIFRKILEDKVIIVDVDDWREKDEIRLKDLAERTAQRAIETKAPQNLYNLTPAQRRIIHMHLIDKDVITESKGEGIDRYMVITSK